MSNPPEYFIERFIHIPLTGAKLKTIDEDTAACFSQFSFALNELNFLVKAHLFSSHPSSNDSDIDYIVMSQQLMMLRIWSSKAVELVDLLLMQSNFNKSDSKTLRDILESQKDKLQAITDNPAYKIAMQIRHEACMHYSLKAARKNLAFLGDQTDLAFMIHEQYGNSFSKLGDEVVFGARMNRLINNDQSDMSPSEFFESWVEWTIEVTKKLQKIHVEFYLLAFPERLRRSAVRKKLHYVSSRLVGEKRRIPILFRRDKN